MHLTSTKQKILLIILSLFAAVILGETFLRIAGLLAGKKSQYYHKKDDVDRIICIGDSTTYGIGSSNIKKFSYPIQLQRILDKKIVNEKYEVINLGRPGINSSQVVNRFRKNILEYKPTIIIMMIGINDPWNFEESNILKFYNMTLLRKLYLQMGLLLNQSKLYQFVKLVFISDDFRKLEVPDFNEENMSKAVAFYKNDPDGLMAFNRAIASNIAELKKISEDNNVSIIFMKYHNIGWGRPEMIIHNTYKQLKVSVVDNDILFKKAKQLGLNVFGNDKWHPNDYGYFLIAKNVFNKMVALKLIDSNPIVIFE